MALRYLLDTNAVSEPLRPHPAGGIMHRLRQHDGEIAIPSPVWHELRFGCSRLPPSRRRDAVERYIETVVLQSFPVLDYDLEAADWHARERARLVAAGKTPPFVDGQIAAIARVNDLTLVTSNLDDFREFGELKVQSWT
ncbi:MAG: type II toxin-antitoxin system VapC family toxin [Rhodospirillales bacterium]|nr:type II toxin-antitoxin system VapC family toxin [Rhodospirillales bacterium]MDE0380058.1 type II toxin-antitoxin system VapC family toxin [Rhodospirillales bacterium]